MRAKKVVIIAAVAITAIALMAYKKVTDYRAVFDKMQIRPSGVSNISIQLLKLKFNLSLKIVNPTGTAFGVSGLGLAKLKRIIIKYDGNYLATANTNLESFELPAYNETIIENIPIEADNINLLGQLFTATTLTVDKLGISAVIEFLGTEYTIDN